MWEDEEEESVGRSLWGRFWSTFLTLGRGE